MLEAEFWELIERTRAERIDEHGRQLMRSLESLPLEALIDFDAIATAYLQAIDRRELWAAADAIRAGCLDREWERFRHWLVLQGKDVLSRAVHDPESLADRPIDEDPGSDALGLARVIYRARTGRELPPTRRLPVDQTGWPADRVPDYAWTDADTERLFPRLTEMAAWRHFARC